VESHVIPKLLDIPIEKIKDVLSVYRSILSLNVTKITIAKLLDRKPVIPIEKIKDVLSVYRSVLSLNVTEITIAAESQCDPKAAGS